jgi:all-trans-retinol 13,14-reductase
MGLFAAEKALPPFLSTILGPALRWPYLRWAGRTTASVLGEITNNPDLIAVLTAQWGDYGLPPEQSSFGIHAIVAKHYSDGGRHPTAEPAPSSLPWDQLSKIAGEPSSLMPRSTRS